MTAPKTDNDFANYVAWTLIWLASLVVGGAVIAFLRWVLA